MIVLSKDVSGSITVSFTYDPRLVARVKSIPYHRWHPDKKYWSFPDSNGTLAKILDIFRRRRNPYRPYPASTTFHSCHCEEQSDETIQRSSSGIPHFRKGGQGGIF